MHTQRWYFINEVDCKTCKQGIVFDLGDMSRIFEEEFLDFRSAKHSFTVKFENREHMPHDERSPHDSYFVSVEANSEVDGDYHKRRFQWTHYCEDPGCTSSPFTAEDLMLDDDLIPAVIRTVVKMPEAPKVA